MKTNLLIIILIFNINLVCSQVYSNGFLSTGSTSISGVAAPSGYSWSEMQNNAGNILEVNASAGFPAYYNTSGTTSYALADNFVVPVNETWNITSIDFYGYLTSYSSAILPIDVLRVQIFNTDPSISNPTPIIGNLTANVLDANNSGDAFMYRIFNSLYPNGGQPTNVTRKIWKFRATIPATLTAGTYWLEFQAHNPSNLQVFFPASTIVGSRGVVGANSKVHTIASTFSGDVIGWSSNIDGGFPTTAPDFPQDLPFDINGTVTTLNNEDYSLENYFVAYPIPAREKITIVNDSNLSVEKIQIYDIYSRLIIEKKTSDSILEINTSNLSIGNYFIKIFTERGIVTKKFNKN